MANETHRIAVVVLTSAAHAGGWGRGGVWLYLDTIPCHPSLCKSHSMIEQMPLEKLVLRKGQTGLGVAEEIVRHGLILIT